jgi:isoquinoline 1-oxidoreductase
MDLPSRREFLRRVGSGLVVWVVLRRTAGAQVSEAAHPTRFIPKAADDFNAFLSIGSDGRVTCFTGKIEMGQGPVTSLPQMLAEDLDVSVDAVDMVMGDTELCPFDAGTWGSMTTPVFGKIWRAAAAEARGVLLELAADALGVPVSQLAVRDGVVSDTRDASRKITYGQLAGGKRIERRLTVKPSVKSPGQFRVIGKPLLRRDSRDKVTGRALYSGDLRLPGMLYARILRNPAHGASLRTVDTSAAAAIDGVVVVQEPGLVAVLHPLPDVADDALSKVRAQFDPSPSKLDDRNIYEHATTRSTWAPTSPTPPWRRTRPSPASSKTRRPCGRPRRTRSGRARRSRGSSGCPSQA